MRRAGLVPAGQADGLGQDAELLGSTLPQRIIVYFPGTLDSLHHLERWYEALSALACAHPLLVVAQDSRTAAAVRQGAPLDVITVAHYGTLDDLLGRSDVRMALYVDHHPWNFSMLRFTSLVHVALLNMQGPGSELETNQVKAYDYIFTTDPEVTERLSEVVYRDDSCFTVGPRGEPSIDGIGLVAACEVALAAREVEWARVQAAGAVGP